MCPVYTELSEEALEALLAPYQDDCTELSKERAHEDAFLKQQQCPTCGGSDHTPYFVSPQHAFGHGNLLARRALECSACHARFDPHTRLVLNTGNLASAIEAVKANMTPGFGAEVIDAEELDKIAERVRRNTPG